MVRNVVLVLALAFPSGAQAQALPPLVVYPRGEAPAPAPAAPARDINLVCNGTASKEKATSAGIFAGGSFAVATGQRQVNFDDSVGVRLRANDSGEVRVPRKILPLVRDGGRDGWYPLINVSRSDREILAQVRLNVNYKPRLRIDRMSGRVTLEGMLGDFTGQCEAYEVDSKPKF